MITIDKYTGTWQRGLSSRRNAPRLGSYIRMPKFQLDAREYFDFKFILNMANKDIEFVRWLPRKGMDVFKIVKKNY